MSNFSVKLVNQEKKQSVSNTNENLQKFRNFANQMVSLSLRNKKGEITDKQGLSLYRSYINLFGHNDRHGVCVVNDSRNLYHTFANVTDEKSKSSTNISLDEQEEVLNALANEYSIGLDEVAKVLNQRDAELAKQGKKIQLEA